MANTFTEVIPKLLAQGLTALRENAVMPRLVNGDYGKVAAEKGTTIDVPIPSAITATAVSPNNTAPVTADVAPTSAQIPLDQWFEAAFYLTDKDMLEIQGGTIPMQASEAIKAIGNNVDKYLLGLYKDVYGYQGTAGTTPFATDTSDATGINKVLHNQLAPNSPRWAVINPDAEANALGLRAFQDMSFSGSAQGLIDGKVGRKLGFGWLMDQNVPTHTSTVLTAGNATVNGAHAVGVTSVSIAKATNAAPLVNGDIITFAGDTQTYVVTTAVTLAVGNTAVSISPALKVAAAGGEAMALKASHTVNFAFHRDCIAFASRPLLTVGTGLGTRIMQSTDPVTGLSLRLEVSREHKRTRFSYDILYGAAVVRPEFGVRLAG